MENMNFLNEIPLEILVLGFIGTITLILILKTMVSIIDKKKKPKEEVELKEYWTRERLDEYYKNQKDNPSY
jgi:hypothetical protein